MNQKLISMVLLASLFCCTDKIVQTESRKDVTQFSEVEVERSVARKVKKQNDFVAVSTGDPAQPVFPNANWLSLTPERVGWSSEKLDEAKSFFEALNADAALVVVNGYVIASWGDPTEVIESRSMRKSYLNAVLGLYSGDPKFKPSATLQDLAINDKQPLTVEEMQATLEDLLTSRSGIYHAAAYVTGNEMPPRGTHKPGQVFKYNNWDFNVLGTIFNQQSGQDLFEVFDKRIARPLGMQDFNIKNTRYEYSRKSQHPAYLFSTSARDDARFALLYLNKGNWNGQQLLSEEWITASTTKQIDTNRGIGYAGYGYLWWTDTFNNHEVFLARGNSAQYILVDPTEKVIVVFRADPGSVFKKWLGMRVTPQQSWDLLRKIYQAKK